MSEAVREPQRTPDVCPACAPHGWHGLPCDRNAPAPGLVHKCPCMGSYPGEQR